uniref:Uncharacterized protein n=1 Tax=Ficedula albicollis TaxID=59894 RepID=A0A803WG74_FICAL
MHLILQTSLHIITIPEQEAAFYSKPTQCQPDFRFMGLVLQLLQFVGGLYAYKACLLVPVATYHFLCIFWLWLTQRLLDSFIPFYLLNPALFTSFVSSGFG